MRTQGSARRSRASWSDRCVSSFSRASSALRSAIHRSRDTTRWGSVFSSAMVWFMVCSLWLGLCMRSAVWACALVFGSEPKGSSMRRCRCRAPVQSPALRRALTSSRWAAFRALDGAHLAARAAAAVEELGPVGLEPADEGAAGHAQPLEHRAALRVDVAQLALVAFPGAVPELAVDPGHAGDEAVRFDGAQHLAGGRVDLVDLAVAVLPHPQAALGPGEPRVAALAGRRDRGQHLAAGRVDLVDARLGDLIEVAAVEGGAGIAGASQRARGLAARGVE